MKKTKKDTPLMYISQPDLKVENTSNQKDYYSKEREKEREAERARFDPHFQREHFVTHEKKDNIDEDVTHEKAVHKPFKDMSIYEKIEYVMNIPFYLPKVPCEILTESGTYKGVIKSFDKEANVMTLKVPGVRQPMEFAIHEIQKMRLSGM
ncbi:CotO family spore coat protein [Bacillus sp. HMF5848]|uniref:CotO family spore coat protein n=1 Tax=Bacillus sp. HMF5848 TaxID=2495421 RepID=UPI00163A06F7|nr:CotO family spore coat protein [Bacillus sp. HMF5848]